MIDVKKDEHSDDFIIKKAVKVDGFNFAEEYRFSACDMQRLFYFFLYNWTNLPIGTNLDTALRQMKLEKAERDYHEPIYTTFNGVLINSDMTIDEAYKKVIGCNKAEFDKKVKEQMARHGKRDQV